jgi:hypothetical protein
LQLPRRDLAAQLAKAEFVATDRKDTGVKLAIFAIFQVLGPMLSDVRIAQIATLTQF